MLFSYNEVNVQLLSARQLCDSPAAQPFVSYLGAPVGFTKQDHYIFIVGGIQQMGPEFCKAIGRAD